MRRCIQLAKNGLGTTYPNPMVGCVIVYDDHIIGEGWHRKAGEPHAEVNAIESVSDKSLLKEAAIYVSLEPCSHHGRTPPCADRIISEGIKNVIVGSNDPNPQVAGTGIERLKDAGCEVITEVLQDECDELNKRFFTFHRMNRPYIILKWAETVNRFMAPTERSKREPVWISNSISRQLVHKMRAVEAAILIGSKTVLEDDPSLTTREWQGSDPLRIIINTQDELPQDARVLDGSVDTLVFQASDIAENYKNAEVISLETGDDVLNKLCSTLFERDIQSLIVEGGSNTLKGFIDSGLWDEAHIFRGQTEFSSGVPSPDIEGKLIDEIELGGDRLRILKNSAS